MQCCICLWHLQSPPNARKRMQPFLMCTRETSRLYSSICFHGTKSAPCALKTIRISIMCFEASTMCFQIMSNIHWYRSLTLYVFWRPKPNLLTMNYHQGPNQLPRWKACHHTPRAGLWRWWPEMVEAKTHCSTHYPAHPWWCNWQECQLIFFQCFEIPFGCQEHSFLARSSKCRSQEWRKPFWRSTQAAKEEAEDWGWEQNCPPWSWWPQSPVLDVWEQTNQKWSCSPAWSKWVGTTYPALQECRPCKPAGQKMVQKQCWQRLKAVGGKRFFSCDSIEHVQHLLL